MYSKRGKRTDHYDSPSVGPRTTWSAHIAMMARLILQRSAAPNSIKPKKKSSHPYPFQCTRGHVALTRHCTQVASADDLFINHTWSTRLNSRAKRAPITKASILVLTYLHAFPKKGFLHRIPDRFLGPPHVWWWMIAHSLRRGRNGVSIHPHTTKSFRSKPHRNAYTHNP